jgi:hypothetical protein
MFHSLDNILYQAFLMLVSFHRSEGDSPLIVYRDAMKRCSASVTQNFRAFSSFSDLVFAVATVTACRSYTEPLVQAAELRAVLLHRLTFNFWPNSREIHMNET